LLLFMVIRFRDVHQSPFADFWRISRDVGTDDGQRLAAAF